MQFSVEWLRELGAPSAAAAELAAALTSRGLPVEALLEQAGRTVLHVDVPANRPDCLGHRGLVRELGAAFGTPRPAPPAPVDGSAPESAARVRVQIAAPELCARYTARVVRRVRVGPSPPWVAERLEACGLRAINNVVDASNLVLLELGHPIHCFDLERIAGVTVCLRRARQGEALITLDGVSRRLSGDMLVVATDERAVALAGVMGGADTEIRPETRDVLVEAAWFQPQSVRATSRALELRTDASHRFERGVDPEGALAAQHLAARLLAELAGGEPASGVVDEHPRPRPARRLTLRPGRLERLLGFDPGREPALEAFERLELGPRVAPSGEIEIQVPSWRVDLEREVDLIEEVARHVGYERVPETMRGLPASVLPTAAAADDEERARDLLAAAGLHEALGYAMIGEDEDADFVEAGCPPPLRLVNPIAETMTRLRRSLVPGLIRAADGNHRRGVRDVRLFETGAVFRARNGAARFPEERSHAAVAWSGAARPRHWSEAERLVDLPDLAGLVEYLLDGLRPGLVARRATASIRGLHPGRSMRWMLEDGSCVAWAGGLHPDRERRLEHGLWLAEVDLEALRALVPVRAQFRPLSRLAPVSRDLSLRLGPEPSCGAVLEELARVPAPAAVRFEVLDRYAGPPLASDEVALTIRATLEPSERTLVESEIEAFRRALVDALARRFGIAVRGEEDRADSPRTR